jgi:hypothetical protein
MTDVMAGYWPGPWPCEDGGPQLRQSPTGVPGLAVRPGETGELLSYDFDHEAGTENVVVLDIESGEEKGRSAINSPVQCVVFPAIGWSRKVYPTTFSTVAPVWVE